MLILLTLLFVLITGFTISSFHSFFYQTTQKELFERVSMCADRFTLLLQDSDSQHPQIESEVQKLSKRGNVRLTLILTDGTVMSDSHEDSDDMENHYNRPEIQAALETGHGHNVRFSDTLDQQMMYSAIKLTDNDKTLGILRMAISTEALRNELADLIIKIILGGFLIVLGSALSAWWISRRISQPLEVLKNGAVRISNGHLDTQLPPFTTYELDEMSSIGR